MQRSYARYKNIWAQIFLSCLLINIVRSVFLEASVTCSTWPKAPGWTCEFGGKYKRLDTSMGISQTSECEALCHQQKANGCCLLSATNGCYWRTGAVVRPLSTSTSIAVDCIVTGILLLTKEFTISLCIFYSIGYSICILLEIWTFLNVPEACVDTELWCENIVPVCNPDARDACPKACKVCNG